jgi:hypothetical protein
MQSKLFERQMQEWQQKQFSQLGQSIFRKHSNYIPIELERKTYDTCKYVGYALVLESCIGPSKSIQIQNLFLAEVWPLLNLPKGIVFKLNIRIIDENESPSNSKNSIIVQFLCFMKIFRRIWTNIKLGTSWFDWH